MDPASRSPLSSLRVAARVGRFGLTAGAGLAAWEGHHRLHPEGAMRESLREAYKRRIATQLMRSLGVRWDVHGEVPRDEGPTLVVANHRSAIDIGVMLATFGGRMLSRADLAAWPILGPLATHGQTIFVDREDKSSGARAIRAIRTSLKGGATVTVFPEGRTLAGDLVEPFQPGAFVAAKGTGARAIPVGLAYEPGGEWFDGGFGEYLTGVAARPALGLSVVVGEPLALPNDPRDGAAMAQEAVQALTHRARQELEDSRAR